MMNQKRKIKLFFYFLFFIIHSSCVSYTKYDLEKSPFDKKLKLIYDALCIRDTLRFSGDEELLFVKENIDTIIKDKKSNFMGTLPLKKYIYRFREINDTDLNYYYSIERSPLRNYTSLTIAFYGFYESYDSSKTILEELGKIVTKHKTFYYHYVLSSTNDNSYVKNIFVNSTEGFIAFTTKNSDTFFVR